MSKSNKVSCLVNKKQRDLIQAEIERNGTRAIDTGVFTLPRNVPVTKGDLITYIQDETNIKHLVGIWNFFDNTRDESGYDNDGLEDANETTATYGDGCDGRRIIFNAVDANKVKITNDADHMQFDGQFDIIIWFASAVASNPEGALFSKGDASQNRIQIETTTESSNEQYVKATIIKGGETPVVITGDIVNIYNTSTTDSSGYHFVRLKRDENSLVTLSVDKITEGTATVRGNINTGSTFLYIGADYAGTNVPKASIAQVRFYSGGYVPNDEFLRLMERRRQPNTMKFGGRVWKIDEKPTHTVAHCKGIAKILHDIEVNSDAPSEAVTWTTSDTDIYKNIYTEKSGVEILTNLMAAWNTGIKVVDVNNSIGNNYEYDEYTAVGTLYENVVILTLNGSNNSSFSVDSRGVLRLESNDIDYHTGSALGLQQTSNNHDKFSAITFKEGVVRIGNLGYDDSSTVTVVTGITNIKIRHKVVVGTHSGNTPNFTDGYTTCRVGTGIKPMNPSGVKVTYSDGTILENKTFEDAAPSGNEEFKMGWEPAGTGGYSLIILGAAAESSGNYTIEYDYEDLGNDNFYTSRSANADDLGEIAKRLFLPQLTNAQSNTNLTNFLSRFLNRFGSLNRRFTLTAPTFLNHVRENYKVKIIDEHHGQSTELSIPVKSVKYYYPNGITEIDCGDHHLDAYDLDNAFGSALHELRTGITKTQPI